MEFDSVIFIVLSVFVALYVVLFLSKRYPKNEGSKHDIFAVKAWAILFGFILIAVVLVDIFS